MKYRIGLTGGIGSGKSTVAALFSEHGVAIIDCDVISHQLTQPDGMAIPVIHRTFGSRYIRASGALDRTLMRELIFSDRTAKRQLEDILHPMIREQIAVHIENVQKYDPAPPYLMIVIPLLFETLGYMELIQRTLVVDCEEITQITRTMQRSGLDEQSVRAIMASQIMRSSRLQQADDIICNDGDLENLSQQVNRLHQFYLACSSGTN